jgi:hypothetical protein
MPKDCDRTGTGDFNSRPEEFEDLDDDDLRGCRGDFCNSVRCGAEAAGAVVVDVVLVGMSDRQRAADKNKRHAQDA